MSKKTRKWVLILEKSLLLGVIVSLLFDVLDLRYTPFDVGSFLVQLGVFSSFAFVEFALYRSLVGIVLDAVGLGLIVSVFLPVFFSVIAYLIYVPVTDGFPFGYGEHTVIPLGSPLVCALGSQCGGTSSVSWNYAMFLVDVAFWSVLLLIPLYLARPKQRKKKRK